MAKNRYGTIKTNGADIWPHELVLAKILADSGYQVEFIPINHREFAKTPDIKLNGVAFEMKSPRSEKLSSVERNLKKAYLQSENIIFSSQRMSRLPDKSIEKELIKQFKLTKKMKRLLFVNRKSEIVDIGALV